MQQTYVTLLEEAELAHEAARQRLERAQMGLVNFHREHSALVGNGELVYIVSSPAVRDSLDHERRALELEIDESTRVFNKSLKDWSDLKN